jgi:parallel beta-helix repeat protein
MTVQGLTLTNEGEGVLLAFTNDSKIANNDATNDYEGIYLYSSSNNTVSGNDMTANSYCGIFVYYNSSNNVIYHNNFVANVAQVYIDSTSVGNVWDNGYPSGGNYWSDYNGTDLYSGSYQNVTGSDGIGDTPYVIDANNTDYYPLMGPFSDFSVAAGVDVQVVSNSTVSDFEFNGTAILFNVTGANGTTGFCHVCAPTTLVSGNLTVFVNGTQVQYSLLPGSNSSVSYLYFTYGHSTEQVIILPEFLDSLILAIFMLATLLTVAIHKKKHRVRYYNKFFTAV